MRAGDGEVGALVGGVVAHCGGVGEAVYGRAHVCAHGAQVRIGHRTQHDHVGMPMSTFHVICMFHVNAQDVPCGSITSKNKDKDV